MARADADTTVPTHKLNVSIFLERMQQLLITAQSHINRIPENRFERIYLQHTIACYLTVLQDIQTKMKGGKLAQLSLLRYLTSSPFKSISSNDLPFIFLPERIDSIITLQLSDTSVELLTAMHTLLQELDYTTLPKKIAKEITELIDKRLKKITDKLDLARDYHNTLIEYQTLEQLIQSKIAVVNSTEPSDDIQHVLDSALETLGRDFADYIMPAREPMKGDVEGSPAEFLKKNKALIEGPIHSYFKLDEIELIATAFTQSDLTQPLTFQSSLTLLAQAISELLDKAPSSSAQQDVNSFKKRLHEICMKKDITVKKITAKAVLCIAPHIQNMNDYTSGLLKNAWRLQLLLASTHPHNQLIQHFLDDVAPLFFLLSVSMHPTMKKHQHQIVSDSVDLLGKKLQEIIGCLMEHTVKSDIHAEVCKFAFQLKAYCNLDNVPADKYKKTTKSRIKSAVSHALKKSANPQPVSLTHFMPQAFFYLISIMNQLCLSLDDRSLHAVMKHVDEIAQCVLNLVHMNPTIDPHYMNDYQKNRQQLAKLLPHFTMFTDTRSDIAPRLDEASDTIKNNDEWPLPQNSALYDLCKELTISVSTLLKK